mgnify:CR=1 FL=1
MATTNQLLSYGDLAAKEDVVLNAVSILTARETMLLNMLGGSVAINTIHSFLTDTLAAAGTQAVAESDDYTNLARTTPARLTNIVEIVAIPFRVSRTQRDISHYTGEDELARQTEKALMEWANAAEFDIVRSSLVSGVSGTVAKMNGLIVAISKSTNTTAHNSGTVWSASILDGLMLGNWDNSNGDTATDLFMGSFLRNATDAFTQKSNMVVNAVGATAIVRTVSTYETAMGTVSIHKHRYVQQSGDATARVLALRPEKLKLAWLRKPYIDTELSRSGDYDARAVVGKLTVEVRNQDVHWFASGFDKD